MYINNCMKQSLSSIKYVIKMSKTYQPPSTVWTPPNPVVFSF